MPNLAWEVLWRRPGQYNTGLVALLPENVPLPELLERMARESYQLAKHREQVRSRPHTSIDLRAYITPNAKPEEDGTRVVLNMDVVEGIACRTQIRHIVVQSSPGVFEFPDGEKTHKVDLHSLGLKRDQDYLLFNAEVFRARGDPEQYLYEVRRGLRGEVDF